MNKGGGMNILEGKVCIITGGAGSIGSAACRLFAAEGAKVGAVDLNAKALAALEADFPSGNLVGAVADVTDSGSISQAIGKVVGRFGKIDCIFVNAGLDGPLMPITDYPEDLFDRVVASHVRGGFLTCKYAIPHMKDGGSIVITSSIVGLRGVPGNCSYVMAKHALTGLMRGLAHEMGSRRIRVNTVNPGPVDNEFMRTAEVTLSQVLGQDAGKWFDQRIPFGRHARPEEVAQAALFLASDNSSYINGSAIMVDGGFSA